MPKDRTIAVFTGNRAEYGLLFPIIMAVQSHPGLICRLLVSGAHLDGGFGATRQEIAGSGFAVDAEIHLERHDDSLYSTARAIGGGIQSIADALDRLRPDVLLVYGDRFEALAACVAGTQMGIPTAHVEGGDITEGGALDDSVRHAMTKLAHMHFTTNEEAAARVLRLGEEPWRIFNTGLPAIDLISKGDYATPMEISTRYGVDPERPLIVFTQHSVAASYAKAAEHVRISLDALRVLVGDGVQLVLTYPNNDAGGQLIIDELAQFAVEVPGVLLERSLGRYNYYGMLNLCGREGRGGCVGNASSGIKETPVFGCPAVNIGPRQRGRLRGGNVLDVDYDAGAILGAIRTALWDEEFRRRVRAGGNPYGSGDTGAQIAEVLASIELGSRILNKRITY